MSHALCPQARKSYDAVAANATVLFFTVSDMASVDPMYHFSLDWFLRLLTLSLDHATKSANAHERTRHLNDHLTFQVYAHLCRSLLERHKLLFSFLLAANLMRHHHEIGNDEWLFFLCGGSAVGRTAAETRAANPLPDWLSEKCWQELNRYAECCRVPFLDSLASDAAAWKLYCERAEFNAMPNEKRFVGLGA